MGEGFKVFKFVAKNAVGFCAGITVERALLGAGMLTEPTKLSKAATVVGGVAIAMVVDDFIEEKVDKWCDQVADAIIECEDFYKKLKGDR